MSILSVISKDNIENASIIDGIERVDKELKIKILCDLLPLN